MSETDRKRHEEEKSQERINRFSIKMLQSIRKHV